MEQDTYVIINSEGVCENKVVWDGISEWCPPPETLLAKEEEVGMILDIGDVVAMDLPVEVYEE